MLGILRDTWPIVVDWGSSGHTRQLAVAGGSSGSAYPVLLEMQEGPLDARALSSVEMREGPLDARTPSYLYSCRGSSGHTLLPVDFAGGPLDARSRLDKQMWGVLWTHAPTNNDCNQIRHAAKREGVS